MYFSTYTLTGIYLLMKKILTCAFFVLTTAIGLAQNIDSLLALPKTLKLKISTPQPRFKEKFQITLDIGYVRAHIFKSAFKQLQFAEDVGNTDQNLMILDVNAITKGKNEIGPLQFMINGTQYTTNKIQYEVIDALPETDKGLWFRKVTTSDSTFCIIIEQRIPASNRVTKVSAKETKYWTEPLTENIARFKFSYSIDGLDGHDAASYTDYGYFYNGKGEEIKYMFSHSINYFEIIDRKKKIVITKDKFDNLPKDFKFENIVIQ
jgi:hypothetical protein